MQRRMPGHGARREAQAAGWMSGLVWLCVLCLLAGCVLPTPFATPLPAFTPEPTPDLHLPGVTKIPGITELEASLGALSLNSVATYLPAGQPGQGRVLFTVTNGQTHEDELYEMGVDGSGLHRLPLRVACGGQIAVTGDGRWLACRNPQGIALLALNSQPPDPGRELGATGVGGLYDVAWAPDSHHLAVRSGLGGGCSIALYTASASYTTLRLTAVLALPQLVPWQSPTPGCLADWPSWSPDGQWLTFISATIRTATVFGLPLASIRSLLDRTGVQPASIVIPLKMLVPLGVTDTYPPPVWSPIAPILTVATPNRGGIAQIDLRTGAQTVLFRAPVWSIWQLAWTPSGRQLVFGLGKLAAGEEIPPPEQLYVYTPLGG